MDGEEGRARPVKQTALIAQLRVLEKRISEVFRPTFAMFREHRALLEVEFAALLNLHDQVATSIIQSSEATGMDLSISGSLL